MLKSTRVLLGSRLTPQPAIAKHQLVNHYVVNVKVEGT